MEMAVDSSGSRDVFKNWFFLEFLFLVSLLTWIFDYIRVINTGSFPFRAEVSTLSKLWNIDDTIPIFIAI